MTTNDRQQSGLMPPLISVVAYPHLGIVATLVGTALAVALVPHDPTPAGALRPSGIALTVGLLLSPAIACIRDRRAVVRIENLLMLGLVYWLLLDLIQGSFPLEVARDAIADALAAVGVFASCLWLGTLMFRPRVPRVIAQYCALPVSARALFRIALLCFVLAMLCFAIPANFDPVVMIGGVLSNRWSAPWARGQFGGWDSFRDHLAYFGYVLPALAVALAMMRGWFDRRTLAVLLMAAIFLPFLASSGSRRLIGVTLGSAILLGALLGRGLSIKVFLSVVGLLVALQWMLAYRNVGFGALVIGYEMEVHTDRVHVDDNILRLAQTIDLVPRRQPFAYEKRILYTLCRPIPRVLWPEKPSDPGFVLDAGRGYEGTSLSASVIADWYVMLGWPTLILGALLFGWLARVWGHLLQSPFSIMGAMIYSLGCMAMFVSLRGLDELVLQSYAILALLLVTHFFVRPAPG